MAMPPQQRFPFQGPRPMQQNQQQLRPTGQVLQPIEETKQSKTTAPPPVPKSAITTQDLNPLRSLLQNIDSDTLLILALLLLLSKEQKDRRLLLALAYIIL